jgi:alkanesulfonate monooxygenase SsuD/methylene tetrahydromethanopterin reductase-like flavin-dependent oxidoreductase (luciferase family)
MRYGVSTFATDEGIRPVALGKALEERGFDSLFLAEHTHIPLGHDRPYPGGGELPRRYYRTLDPSSPSAPSPPSPTGSCWQPASR